MTDVERSGRIDADELHLYPLALPEVDIAVGFASLEDGFYLLGQPITGKGKIDKSGWDGNIGRNFWNVGYMPLQYLSISNWAFSSEAG